MSTTFKQVPLFSCHPPDRAGLPQNKLVLYPGEIYIGFRVVPEPIITNAPRVKELAICFAIGDVIGMTDHVVSVPLEILPTLGTLVTVGEPGLPCATAHLQLLC
jgi:hypothetical protein